VIRVKVTSVGVREQYIKRVRLDVELCVSVVQQLHVVDYHQRTTATIQLVKLLHEVRFGLEWRVLEN